MPRLLGRRLALGLLVLLSIAPLRAQLTFTFDYTLDTDFFTNNPGHRQALEAAGAYVSQYFTATTLLAITPPNSDSWNVKPTNPSDPSINPSSLSLGNLSVPANTVIVYVGAVGLSGGVLARAGPAGYSPGAQVDGAWYNGVLKSRDLSLNGYLRTGVGALSFNSSASWFFDSNPQATGPFAVPSDKYDFFSVATHELLHVLGFGDPRAGSGWKDNLDLIDPGYFLGPKVFQTNPDGVLLLKEAGGDHWAAGTLSFSMRDGTSQETLMDPDIASGVRKYLTSLDLRAMQDIGYTTNFTAVPEPAAFGVGAGVISLVWAWRRRGRRDQS